MMAVRRPRARIRRREDVRLDAPPATSFAVVLFSLDGRLQAVIEADRLGQLRTGAASAVAARLLARKAPRPRRDRLRLAGGLADRVHPGPVPSIERVVVYCRDERRRAEFCREHRCEAAESTATPAEQDWS